MMETRGKSIELILPDNRDEPGASFSGPALERVLGLAALQTGAYKSQPQETVALILCGANFDSASLA